MILKAFSKSKGTKLLPVRLRKEDYYEFNTRLGYLG